MSIDSTRLTHSVNSGGFERNLLLSDARSSIKVDADRALSATKIQISPLAQRAISNEAQDIDTDRVNKIRQQLDSGEYQYDFGKIADALLKNIIES